MSTPDDRTGSEQTDDQIGKHGLRDTTKLDTPADAPPEQSAGGEEPHPDGRAPKAGYPTLDPRHEEKPYEP